MRWIALFLLMIVPASAQECKELINAAGSATIMGENAAMRSAITNWQRDVIAKYGSQWMQWDRAQDKVSDCGSASVGTLGRYMIRCTLAARPCGGNVTVVAEQPNETEGRSCEDYSESRVRDAQAMMNTCRACGSRIKVDGSCGPQTERCLRAFQRVRGLNVTSVPDRATMVALREFCGR